MLGCNYAILYNERASDKILGLMGNSASAINMSTSLLSSKPCLAYWSDLILGVLFR
jgi:hypothetical protein